MDSGSKTFGQRFTSIPIHVSPYLLLIHIGPITSRPKARLENDHQETHLFELWTSRMALERKRRNEDSLQTNIIMFTEQVDGEVRLQMTQGIEREQRSQLIF